MKGITMTKTNNQSDMARSNPTENFMVRNCRSDLATLDEKARSIDSTLVTENPVQSWNMSTYKVDEDVLLMDGLMSIPAQIPLVDEHQISGKTIKNVLGSTRSIRIENGELVGTNFFSSVTEGQSAFTKVKEGHVTDNSIRYQPLEYVSIPPGQARSINGVEYAASKQMARRIVTKWLLKDNSLTAVGADQMAKMRSQLSTNIRSSAMDKFETWLTEKGHDFATLSDVDKTVLRSAFDVETKARAAVPVVTPTPTPTQTATPAASSKDAINRVLEDVAREDKIRADAVNAEHKRQATIRGLAGPDIDETVVRACIDQRLSIEDTKDVYIRHLRNNAQAVGSPGIIIRNNDVTRTQLEASLLLRSGYEKEVLADPKYGQDVANQADSFRSMPLLDMFRHALRIDNVAIPNGTNDLIRTAWSTVTLPYLLGNVANKAMMRGYTEKPSTWRPFATVGSVSNFQTQTRVRMTDANVLTKVNHGGEIPHGTAEEEVEQFNVDTYAEIFTITRQNIINDDLNAFTKIPENKGRKAQRKISDVFWEEVMANAAMGDTVALFHANHSNLNTSAALALATLGTAVQAFMKQTDADGQSISVTPHFLIVPPTLAILARELTLSPTVVVTDFASGVAAVRQAGGNVHAGTLTAIAEPRLENSTYTNYSTTTWYMASTPSEIDTVEVAFLNGQESPTIEKFTADPETLGIVYRVYLDFGVKALDWRGLQKNTA